MTQATVEDDAEKKADEDSLNFSRCTDKIRAVMGAAKGQCRWLLAAGKEHVADHTTGGN
jgi:hypothetical protein